MYFVIIGGIFFFNFIKTTPFWIKKSIFFFYIIFTFFLRVFLFLGLIFIPILNSAFFLCFYYQIWITSLWNTRIPVSMHIWRNIFIFLAILSLHRHFITNTWIFYREWCPTNPNCFSNTDCLLIFWLDC